MRRKLCVFLLTLLVLVMVAMTAIATAQSKYPEIDLTLADLSKDNNSPYKLGTILKNYNVFVKGNYDGTHVVGPVVVGGETTFTGGFGGLSTDPTPYPHPAPSYFKGEIVKIGNQTDKYSLLTGSASVPVFIGSANKQKTLYTQFDAPVYVADNFIDFSMWKDDEDASKNTFYKQTLALKSKDIITIPANDIQTVINAPWGPPYTTKGDSALVNTPYYIKKDTGTTVKLSVVAGRRYLIEDLSKVSSLYIKESSTTGNADTIIYSEATYVNLPKTYFSNTTTGNVELTKTGMGLVFALPEATYVYAKEPTGHIVAPQAHVRIVEGNFNGCVLAASLDADAEGHMWPYNGEELPMLLNGDFPIYPDNLPANPPPTDGGDNPDGGDNDGDKPNNPTNPDDGKPNDPTSPDDGKPDDPAKPEDGSNNGKPDEDKPTGDTDPTSPDSTTTEDISGLPKTGDNSNLALFAALLTISLALLGLMASRRRSSES